MKIISGCAANLELFTPPNEVVRPTLGRTRKALFDHLGDLNGSSVLDLCAGAGGLGLESASRGAGRVIAVEKIPAHCELISRNWDKVRRTGCTGDFRVLCGDVLDTKRYAGMMDKCDLILADPPYDISAEIFGKLLADSDFCRLAADALIVWEVPDHPGAAGEFMEKCCEKLDFEIRRFGATVFLEARLKGSEV